jgi:hypothetical protein
MTINQQEFLIELQEKGFGILRTKRADYTGSSDVLDIFKDLSLRTGVTARKLIEYEIEKKKMRIRNLSGKENINHESVEDNLLDIMNYHFLALCLDLEHILPDDLGDGGESMTEEEIGSLLKENEKLPGGSLFNQSILTGKGDLSKAIESSDMDAAALGLETDYTVIEYRTGDPYRDELIRLAQTDVHLNLWPNVLKLIINRLHGDLNEPLPVEEALYLGHYPKWLMAFDKYKLEKSEAELWKDIEAYFIFEKAESDYPDAITKTITMIDNEINLGRIKI